MDIDKNIVGIKMDKNGREYVSNRALYEQIVKSKEKDELTYEALQMLLLMIDNISNAKRFPNVEDKEDCKSQAIQDCLQYWKSYDTSKPNAFAYFTSMIVNGIAKGWNTLHPEKKKAEGSIFTSLDNNIYSI